MRPAVYGIVFFVIGAIYLWKPTIFRRGLWMKTSIAIRTLSETNIRVTCAGLASSW